MSRYNTPPNSELDEYGHMSMADTDPYGRLEWCIGSGDDFICFDYHLGAIDHRTMLVLHATLNSETGSFIQDFDYIVVDGFSAEYKVVGDFEADCLIKAYGMIGGAIEWCINNGVKHDKSGWNQDQYYFLRSIAKSIDSQADESYVRGIVKECSKRKSALRFGGKRINRMIRDIAEEDLDIPVSRKTN